MTSTFNRLWAMAPPKDGKGAWVHSTWPVVRTTVKTLERRWNAVCKGMKEEAKEELLVTIELALHAQQKSRAAQKRANNFCPQPMMFERWLNDENWTMEIQSAMEPPKSGAKLCKCGQPVHGPAYSVCTDCLSRAYG